MTLHDLMQMAAQQQMLVAALGATVTGGLLFGLRQVPGHIWTAVREVFTTSLTVQSTEEIYQHINLWFSRQQAASKARRLMLAQEYDYDDDLWKWRLSIGKGWHLLWLGRTPVIVHREVKEGGELAQAMGTAPCHILRLITLGRSHAAIRAVIDAAERVYKNDGRVKVAFWSDGGFVVADQRRPRPLATVYMPAAQKRRVLGDAERFLASRADYIKRGTPWRRGYLFEGPPGTGKTTLIFAIAGALGKSVFTLNLNNFYSDNQLLAAFNNVPADAVLVIEDIDTAKVAKNRELQEQEDRAMAREAKRVGAPPATSGLSLSGLLNAIDGIAAREGRMLFVTSNHPDVLDPALIRPGRIDLRERIDLLDRESASDMFAAFRPAAPAADFEREVAPLLPIAAADLQNRLLGEPEHEVVPFRRAQPIPA